METPLNPTEMGNATLKWDLWNVLENRCTLFCGLGELIKLDPCFCIILFSIINTRNYSHSLIIMRYKKNALKLFFSAFNHRSWWLPKKKKNLNEFYFIICIVFKNLKIQDSYLYFKQITTFLELETILCLFFQFIRHVHNS